MNKKVTIVVIVVVLLLLGFFVFSKNREPKMSDSGNKNSEVATTKSSPKTLKDLLTAGVSQKCTFKDTSDSASMEGTTYVSGGMVRGDFSTTVNGKNTSGHTIFKDKTSYVWMDGTSTGFKMTIDPSMEEKADEVENNQQGLDMNKSLDYNCGVWVTDQALFTPPTDVTFTSFAIPTLGADGDSMTGNQSLCSACNSLSGDQKTQCLTSLKCK